LVLRVSARATKGASRLDELALLFIHVFV